MTQGGALDDGLRQTLLALARRDRETRERRAADGGLFDGYDAEMRAVHDANADALQALLDAHGWPTSILAGEDGADAAWLVAQHAIARPDFQRRCLALLAAAARAGDVPAWQPAMLLDRILVLEGRNQVYGTSFDWDDAGLMSPNPIEDPEGVDARRAVVGLPPLADAQARHRRESACEPRPRDLGERRRLMHEWAKRVGWR